jgi:hypothetical protein
MIFSAILRILLAPLDIRGDLEPIPQSPAPDQEVKAAELALTALDWITMTNTTGNVSSSDGPTEQGRISG